MSERDRDEARALLRALFDAALAAADPARLITAQTLAAYLPQPTAGGTGGRTVVVGAGKASAAMARAFEAAWQGPIEGLVVTRRGHAALCRDIEIVEASHPVPDHAGEEAARRILDLVRGLGPADRLVCLISGGGSALLALPAAGLSLADKQAVTRDLLRSGATIGEINTVRKHLSAIKGGRLAAAAAPAQVVTLAISDVPGDDPAVIASGPTVPDPTTFADARQVLRKYALAPPPAVAAYLDAAAEETPKPADELFGRTRYVLLASPQQALAAAAELAAARGVTPLVLSDRIEGEARDVGGVHAAIALQLRAGHLRAGDRVLAPPAVLLSGGETTVTVQGAGRGGRNVELLLGFMAALAKDRSGGGGIAALACDTDGIDGTEDNAGAIVYPDTLVRAGTAGLSLTEALAANDGYGFFAALGDLVVTGPTLTNVNDFRAVLVLPDAPGG
ncbi:MAG: glycerate kinase type-2 family protein [Thiohalocapsa sp.]